MITGVIIGIIVMSAFSTIGMILIDREEVKGFIFGGPVTWALYIVSLIINKIYRIKRKKKLKKIIEEEVSHETIA